MKVYISGPITGIKNNNKEAFERAEKKLLSKGYQVVNPLKLKHLKSKSREDYLKVDLIALFDCDMIYVLEGYENSWGAKLEIYNAKQLNIKVFYEKS